jgi:hypothetical protein
MFLVIRFRVPSNSTCFIQAQPCSNGRDAETATAVADALESLVNLHEMLPCSFASSRRTLVMPPVHHMRPFSVVLDSISVWTWPWHHHVPSIGRMFSQP